MHYSGYRLRHPDYSVSVLGTSADIQQNIMQVDGIWKWKAGILKEIVYQYSPSPSTAGGTLGILSHPFPTGLPDMGAGLRWETPRKQWRGRAGGRCELVRRLYNGRGPINTSRSRLNREQTEDSELQPFPLVTESRGGLVGTRPRTRSRT
jgi:hypothetical protein